MQKNFSTGGTSALHQIMVTIVHLVLNIDGIYSALLFLYGMKREILHIFHRLNSWGPGRLAALTPLLPHIKSSKLAFRNFIVFGLHWFAINNWPGMKLTRKRPYSQSKID